MMLADQAAQKSPIRKRQVAPDSPDYRGLSTAGGDGGDGAFTNDNSAMGTLLQYGAYFNNMASPMNTGNNNRVRYSYCPYFEGALPLYFSLAILHLPCIVYC